MRTTNSSRVGEAVMFALLACSFTFTVVVGAITFVSDQHRIDQIDPRTIKMERHH